MKRNNDRTDSSWLRYDPRRYIDALVYDVFKTDVGFYESNYRSIPSAMLLIEDGLHVDMAIDLVLRHNKILLSIICHTLPQVEFELFSKSKFYLMNNFLLCIEIPKDEEERLRGFQHDDAPTIDMDAAIDAIGEYIVQHGPTVKTVPIDIVLGEQRINLSNEVINAIYQDIYTLVSAILRGLEIYEENTYAFKHAVEKRIHDIRREGINELLDA